MIDGSLSGPPLFKRAAPVDAQGGSPEQDQDPEDEEDQHLAFR
jgi:hypothetical protein